LRGGASWPNPVTALRKRRGPTPLHPLAQCVRAEAVKATRHPQLAFLLAAWVGSRHPLHHARLLRAFQELVCAPRPVRPQPVGQDLAAHAVAAWTARVRAALPERRLPVVTLQSLCPHGLTKHRVCGCLARGKRIAPRSRSLGLHPSGPVQGQWDCLAVWARAHTSKRLLTTPHRAGLQGLAALPRPAAGSCGAIGDQGCSRQSRGMLPPPWTALRPPRGSADALRAHPLDVRRCSWMAMDCVISRFLVRPRRRGSRVCSSARTCVPRCLQTPPHADARVLRSPAPPSGWQRDVPPPRVCTGPAHVSDLRQSRRLANQGTAPSG